MNNVGLFTKRLARGRTVEVSPGIRTRVEHYPRWPIRLRLHWDRRLNRHWLTAHGVVSTYRQGWDGYQDTPERVITTIYRFGPLLVAFGPDTRHGFQR